MPSASLDEKISKVVKFLMGSTDPRIAGMLGERGFTGDDRAEGWALFDRVVGRVFPVSVGVGQGVPKSESLPIIQQIDAWENLWFEVADAALSRQYPLIRDNLFQNLNRTSGKEVVINVTGFVSRYRQLKDRTDEQSAGAVSLLSKRGLTEERLDEAERLLKSIKSGPPAEEPTSARETEHKAAHEQAISEMWDWYQEWARLSRSAVTNRHQLVALGLTTRRPRRPRPQ